MKKSIMITVLVVGLISVFGCSKQIEQPTKIKPSEPSVKVEKQGKELLEPIYMEVESPDRSMKLITSDIGLVLTTTNYEIINYVIKKEEQVGQGFESIWSSDSKKICISQYGELNSTFFTYDVGNKMLTPIFNAHGLDKAEVDSAFDWYPSTNPVCWLDNERVVFNMTCEKSSVLHRRGQDGEKTG